MLLLIHFSLLLPLFVFALLGPCFLHTVLSVFSSFAIILKTKRELVALL